MIRLLLKLALASAAVAAIWTWVPVQGRSMAERWRAAPTAGAFVDRTFGEFAGAFSDRAPSRPQARGAPPRERPVERHTEADRRAVDRILADRLDEAPARP